MSYRIISRRDSGDRLILDEPTGKIIADCVDEEGCRPLVELANRAAAEAAKKTKERTAAVGNEELTPGEWITWAVNTFQQLRAVDAVPPDMRAHVEALIKRAP